MRAEVDKAVASARPDDRHSWWTTVDGKEVCNRVNYLNEQSAVIAGLSDDRRLKRVGALGGPELRDSADRLDGQLHEPRPHQTTINIRKLLDTSELFGAKPLPHSFARQLLTLPRKESLDAWLDSLPARAAIWLHPVKTRRINYGLIGASHLTA